MKTPEKIVRQQAVAGAFYPDGMDDAIDFIKRTESIQEEKIKRLLKSVGKQKVSGIIVPHAGWVFSGKTAILAYQLLRYNPPKKITLLGPSHHFPINRIFSDGHSYWKTPLGLIRLFKDNFFEDYSTYHAPEHSLEVQAPFIKYYSPESLLLPLLTGQINTMQATDCAKHLAEHGYFIIISTDLSHFNDLEEAKRIDADTIRDIENLSVDHVTACGSNPLKVAFEYCRLRGLHPQLIDYSTSADTSGDTGNVVGYASFWF
ncbi:MAG TPA: AmmeMemoRadiSam system protein B [Bacteroidetes bacterium]|nr:AmmeMemoRadiSam system protein B [Bacteroidota bacterium]